MVVLKLCICPLSHGLLPNFSSLLSSSLKLPPISHRCPSLGLSIFKSAHVSRLYVATGCPYNPMKNHDKLHSFIYACIWDFEKFFTVSSIVQFHRRAKSPHLPSQSTSRLQVKPSLIFEASIFLAFNLVSYKNSTSRSSHRIRSRKAQISRVFPSSKEF